MRTPDALRGLLLEAVNPDRTAPSITRAYRRAVEHFYRVLRETGSYEEAVRRAEAGASDADVRAYLQGYLSTYLDDPATRIRDLHEPLASAYYEGFEQGGRDQLSQWGERGDRFNLTDPAVIGAITAAALAMATFATNTSDETLLNQAVRSALRLDTIPDLDADHLAHLSSLIAPYRGYNEGRAETAIRSVPDGGIMKTWAVLGAANEPREHHQAIEGLTIHLHDLFPVGLGVKYPHDWDMAGAEEWAYCRHFAEYSAPEHAQIEPWWGEDVDLP